MGSRRHTNVIRRRRRVEDDAEDDGSIITEPMDDSQSEPSLASDADDDGDADDSDLSETELPDAADKGRPAKKANGAIKSEAESRQTVVDSSSLGRPSETNRDTDIMMNGLRASDQPPPTNVEATDFEALGGQAANKPTEQSSGVASRVVTPAERRRREHEEYKKKRDSDPAFIPNRGAFFMHDHRTSAPGQNGFRPFGRGRGGRGRNGQFGPFSPAANSQSNEPTNAHWAHDLHDSLLEPNAKASAQPSMTSAATSNNASATAEARTTDVKSTPPVRSFSTTKLVGKVQLRLSLPGMSKPIVFSDVPVNHYTKLPNHRPPLRRDKPVRISLPDHPIRYIFPATERSFIFIPRALRPNQQGFGRGRGKGLGSIGGFSSRRTSVYGGSMYSPSVAMSRRSSLAREFNRDGLVSPTGSIVSGRPVVRLPPGSHGSHQHTASGTPIHSATISGSGTPVMAAPPMHGYPNMPKLPYRENWPSNIQMHQPRPQKTISVTGIETPASLNLALAAQEQQPFHHQVPQHVNGAPVPPSGQPTDSSFYTPQRQVSYPNQPPQQPSGTPLSNIPERAIHAQPFQPLQQAPGFQTQAFPGQQPYYYPQGPNAGQPQYASGAVIAPVFVQNSQQGSYMVPTIAPGGPQGIPPGAAPGPPGPNMVAHEQNGMVYYYDPSHMYVSPEGYTANYTMPGMGGMMTPTPDGYYYPQVPTGTIYYPPQ